MKSNLATRGQHTYRLCDCTIWQISPKLTNKKTLFRVFAASDHLPLVCEQVMQVVREQITRALAMKPSSLDQLKNKLRGLSYSEILRLRQSERMSQDDFQSPPIMSV